MLAGRPAGLVPVGKRAGRGMRREVSKQPLLLDRTRTAAADVAALAVEADQVPCPEVVGVIALRRIASCGTEVREISGRLRGQVLVVADRRPDLVLERAPRRVEHRGVGGRRVRLVLLIPEGK